MKNIARILPILAALLPLACAPAEHEPVDAATLKSYGNDLAFFVEGTGEGPYDGLVLALDEPTGVATIIWIDNGNEVVSTGVPMMALFEAPSAADFGDLGGDDFPRIGVYYPSLDGAVKYPALFTSRDNVTHAWTGTYYTHDHPEGITFTAVPQTRPDPSTVDPLLGGWTWAITGA